MVKDIITYPTPPSVQYATDVRVFNDEIFSLIDDLKDTIKENDLQGLAAFQIGSYYNIVVVKKPSGKFIELINPRLISNSGRITTTETTAYFPSLSAEVSRYDEISLIYEDREANQHSLKANGEFSVLIQRKLDYTFGATFLSKLSKDEKAKFDKKLEFGSDVAISESCPTTFKRDYLTKLSDIIIISMVILLVISWFISDTKQLSDIWTYQLNLSFIALITNLVYFFYAQYEGREYSSCSSCQIGNIIGTVFIALSKLTLIMLLSYLFINPA